jgi:hypothetical protein
MKPLGMTAAFEIVRSDRVQDGIYKAVEAAIDAGWTPEQFREEAAECWDIYLSEKRRTDAAAWKKK